MKVPFNSTCLQMLTLVDHYLQTSLVNKNTYLNLFVYLLNLFTYTCDWPVKWTKCSTNYTQLFDSKHLDFCFFEILKAIVLMNVFQCNMVYPFIFHYLPFIFKSQKCTEKVLIKLLIEMLSTYVSAHISIKIDVPAMNCIHTKNLWCVTVPGKWTE